MGRRAHRPNDMWISGDEARLSARWRLELGARPSRNQTTIVQHRLAFQRTNSGKLKAHTIGEHRSALDAERTCGRRIHATWRQDFMRRTWTAMSVFLWACAGGQTPQPNTAAEASAAQSQAAAQPEGMAARLPLPKRAAWREQRQDGARQHRSGGLCAEQRPTARRWPARAAPAIALRPAKP